MLKKLRTIVYHVADLEAARRWYSETFGITPYFDEPFYVGFDIGGFELGLDPAADEYTEGTHNITYWQVDNLDEALNQLRQRGVTVVQEPNDVGGGIITASIADPFGNVIGLIEING
jgi:predicted enzyme related to lactoylglutathione lyase